MNKFQLIKALSEKFKLNFNNFDIFENAFVHRSYLNENQQFKLPNNERLEFLGDAVLELAVTKYLYENFESPEGELTAIRSALVRGKNLSEISNKLGVFDCLYLSSGEKKGSEKARGLILANCFEAILGAIYLDLGMGSAEKFIREHVIDQSIRKILDEKLYVDAKSELQELIQEKAKVTPVYKTISESGPDHNKAFESGVYVHEKMIGKGKGSSKNAAEQEAARNGLENYSS